MNLPITPRKSTSIVCTPGVAPEWKLVKHPHCREYQGIFMLFGWDCPSRARIIGRVIEWPRLPVDVYLFNPPRALRNHPHGRCLQLALPNSRWFKLHWQRPARTFDEARAYVETIMSEALQSG